MPVLMPATSTRRSVATLPAVRQHRAYYAQRLQSARANIERLRVQLGPGNSRLNPNLAQAWQNEIIYWRQAERDAIAMLAQLGSANEARLS